MHILIDFRAPAEAKIKLKQYGEVVEFKTENMVYDAISGHPDIFITKVGDKNIVAPNIPKNYLNILSKYNIEIGDKNVGRKYPETVYYNAVVTNDFLIHKKGLTDTSVLRNSLSKHFLNVPQGYTRCSLIEISGLYITSDIGIYKVLKNKGLDTFFVDPKKIVLPCFKHGFFGGTTGFFERNVFFIGSLSYIDEGERIKNLLIKRNYKVIELYDGPLYNGGGIFFFM